jgi:O-antigen/teichoic acid export membrane protein
VNARHLLRAGALIVGAQVAVAFIGVLALRFYTDLVTPAVFGGTNLVLSALGLGLQLFVAGFVAAQLRFYSEAEARGSADDFTRETLVLALRATVVLVALTMVVLVPLQMTGVFSCPAAVVVSGAAWLFAMTVRNVLMSRIQAQRRQTSYAKLQVVEAVLVFGITFTALHIDPSVESFLVGQVLAIGMLLLAILATAPDARAVLRGRPRVKESFGSKAWGYGAPFAPMSFLSWLANLGDRYTLAIMLGSEAAGRYVAPFSIASRGMMLANSALCDLFRPILFDAENRRDDASARITFVRWLLSSVALSSVGLAIVYFGGSLMTRLLLAPGYRSGAVAIMLWVPLGYTISGITQIVECRLLSLGHSARLLLPMILGAMANVGFSIILIRRNGILGAAQATCASFLFQNLATTVFLLLALRRRSASMAQETKIEPA